MISLGNIAYRLKQLEEANEILRMANYNLAWCEAGAPAEEELKEKKMEAEKHYNYLYNEIIIP